MNNTAIKFYFILQIVLLYLDFSYESTPNILELVPGFYAICLGAIGLYFLLTILFNVKLKSKRFLLESSIKWLIIGVLVGSPYYFSHRIGGIFIIIGYSFYHKFFHDSSEFSSEHSLLNQLRKTTYAKMKKNELIEWGVFGGMFYIGALALNLAFMSIPSCDMNLVLIILLFAATINVFVEYNPKRYLPFFGSLLLIVCGAYFADHYLTIHPMILSVSALFVVVFYGNYAFHNPDLNPGFQDWLVDQRNKSGNLEAAR